MYALVIHTPPPPPPPQFQYESLLSLLSSYRCTQAKKQSLIAKTNFRKALSISFLIAMFSYSLVFGF